jgi:NitT/TauT family transport system permease protein
MRAHYLAQEAALAVASEELSTEAPSEAQPADSATESRRQESAWAGWFQDNAAAFLLPVGFAFAALLAWEFGVALFDVHPSVFPPPSQIAAIMERHYAIILRHTVPTLLEILLALGLSIPLAVAIAAATTWSRPVHQALYPNVVIFQLIPKIALAPLFIAWLGIGTESRVTFSIFICFFPILVSTTAGLQAVPRDMLRLCRSVGATDLQVLLHVRFPTCIPYLFAGIKVAVTLAVIGIVVGEFIASKEGLGYLILFASSRQETDLSLACITVLCAVGLLLYGLAVGAERICMKLIGER